MAFRLLCHRYAGRWLGILFPHWRGTVVGKSVLLGQILAGAAADRIVIGLIGERGREISDFLETKLPPAVRAKSVVVATPADEPALLRVRAAERATAIAEAFRAEGHHVLLLIDSLTRVAHAQREIGLALGEPPALKAYPPSVFSLIPKLVERAGNDAHSGGAITALYTVLADGDDVQDPVVDAVRAIVDGHIILSRSLAEAQVYPAIDIGQSISRVMPDIAATAQMQAAATYRSLWSSYAENRDLVLMGAWKAGADPMLDAAIAARPAMLNFLRQSPDMIVDMAHSTAQLAADYGELNPAELPI
jgi:flagellum-specific ATP synthase